MWRVYSSKTKKTCKIPVHDDVAKLVRRLMVTAPSTLLVRDSFPIFQIRIALGEARWR